MKSQKVRESGRFPAKSGDLEPLLVNKNANAHQLCIVINIPASDPGVRPRGREQEYLFSSSEGAGPPD